MCKIYTLEDLKDTGLPVFDSCRHPDVGIGELHLKGSVISMWDWSNYSDYYTFYENDIRHLVKIHRKIDETTGEFRLLKKDLSNLKTAFDEKFHRP